MLNLSDNQYVGPNVYMFTCAQPAKTVYDTVSDASSAHSDPTCYTENTMLYVSDTLVKNFKWCLSKYVRSSCNF